MSGPSPDSDLTGLSTSRLVAEIRARTHETQEALARRLGVSFPTLNAWERGHREPRRFHRVQIEQIAADLGILRGAKVLVIDDDLPTCELIGAHIRSVAPDADVRIVDNGIEGLMVCGSFKPDVVFLDILMPGIDGLEVAKRMAKIDALESVRIVFVTAATSSDILDRAEASGAVTILIKPVSEDDVRNALADAEVLYNVRGEVG